MEAQQQRTVRTMCLMNCHPTLCDMLVDLEGDHVIGVRGDQGNPDSRGFLYVWEQASQEIIANLQRLLHLLARGCRTDAAVSMFDFSAGQASFEAHVEVAPQHEKLPSKK